jgi:hypothetical protein
MESDNTWTAVGKGGRPISFPPEAAAAFGGGGKSRRSAPSTGGFGSRPPRSEFPADAAAAFGRKSRSTPHTVSAAPSEFDADAAAAFGRKGRAAAAAAAAATPSEFDADAAAAFGGGRRETRRGGGSAFDAAAAAAFGGKGRREKRDDAFPDAFGKKKSAFAAAAELGLGDDAEVGYGMSALARKRAEAAAAKPPEQKKQTFEEMFPALGGPAKAAAAAPAPTKSSGKPTLAEIMRKRVAEEEAEALRKAAIERERELAARAEASERARLRGLRAGRNTNFISYTGDDDEETEDFIPVEGDLDYDAYGAKRKELTGPERPEEPSESSSEDDVEEDAEDDRY